MNYIGMDIHKQFTVAVVKDEQGTKLAEEKFDNSEDNFDSFMHQYKPEETKIVIESSSVWEYIYEILEAMHYEVKLANPVRTRAIAEAIADEGHHSAIDRILNEAKFQKDILEKRYLVVLQGLSSFYQE